MNYSQYNSWNNQSTAPPTTHSNTNYGYQQYEYPQSQEHQANPMQAYNTPYHSQSHWTQPAENPQTYQSTTNYGDSYGRDVKSRLSYDKTKIVTDYGHGHKPEKTYPAKRESYLKSVVTVCNNNKQSRESDESKARIKRRFTEAAPSSSKQQFRSRSEQHKQESINYSHFDRDRNRVNEETRGTGLFLK